MNISIRKYWQALTGGQTSSSQESSPLPEKTETMKNVIDLDIAPNDPLLAYLIDGPGVVEIEKLILDSPALQKLKQAEVKVTVPLVSQGELIGLLNLGPRLSEQEYSTDDFRLLGNLATQAAPALRVAQLVLQQQLEARERERIEQELRVARVIQKTLLPKELPTLQGWQIAAHWGPARAVSGDFYDLFQFPDGRIGIVMGDVTDKGVPAALVMATTRSMLRAAAERAISPGEVLARVNERLCPDIPANMFVTCLYGILDPTTGRLQFANAGHNLPLQSSSQGVTELRATGMPLGLMPGIRYEEKESILNHGDTLLVYSDGLVEAHNPAGEMFGFPRLRAYLGSLADQPLQVDRQLIDDLLIQMEAFTGPGWEQEDDVTFVTLQRTFSPSAPSVTRGQEEQLKVEAGRLLAGFSLASEAGNERQAMQLVAEALLDSGLSQSRLERLKTAVAEATMNAMEHGNLYQADMPVEIEVFASQEAITVRILDQGLGDAEFKTETPDLEAKLEGLQSPRGWGLFLIKNMVDGLNITHEPTHHTIELIMNLEGEK